MALGLQPTNLYHTLQQIHAISDEIWFQAGDKAVDVSEGQCDFSVFLVHEACACIEPVRSDGTLHAVRQI